MNLLSSRFRSQHRTNEEIELSQHAMHPHVAEVAPMRDREVLFVAERPQAHRPYHQSAGTATLGARPSHSRPIQLFGHIGLYLCCVFNHHTDGSAQPMQQQQGPVSTQASSLQTTPTTFSTSTTPTTTAPVAATAQPQPLPLRTRFVLFLCCASPPHAVDGH
ncbi:hypothetical protein EDD22DRAFT_170657 [Suillus occidentalis]|nr:hypothetical protein EDD22DRAFT_170657 [Suillus occidentalis]